MTMTKTKKPDSLKDLGIKFWQVAEDENLKKICNNYNIFPNYIFLRYCPPTSNNDSVI